MNILFLSQTYPDALTPEFIRQSKVGLDWAAHNLCTAIIRGFRENNEKLHIINIPHLGSFPPFYKSLTVPPYNNENIDSIGYLNISFIKRISQRNQVLKRSIKWCKQTEGEKYILFYNFDMLPLAGILKMRHPDTKLILLITDLPEFMTANPSILTKFNELISPSPLTRDYYKYIDGYILLAKGMYERVPIGNTPWMLMEGIYNDTDQADNAAKYPERTIVYTGNLGERYGLRDLLKAFSLIDDDRYKLLVRGEGDLQDLVNEYAIRDERIKYVQRMSRKELITMQKRATLMVNPVHSNEEFTHYFFPSKTLEYMASGTPTLMCNLSCLPDDYKDHLFIFEDETPEGMGRTMKEICSKSQSELDSFGNQAAMFIRKEKSPKMQARKIIEFLKKITSVK